MSPGTATSLAVVREVTDGAGAQVVYDGVDVARGVRGGRLAGERDADPAGLTGIDSQNPFGRHRDIITPARRLRGQGQALASWNLAMKSTGNPSPLGDSMP